MFSPDGSKIVFYRDIGGDFEIFIMNADGSGVQQLTNNAASNIRPVFSADGQSIIYQSNTASNTTLIKMNLDGSSPVSVIGGSGLKSDQQIP